MFVITHKSPKGGFWSEGKLVPSFNTEDASIAEAYKANGHTVEEIEPSKSDDKDSEDATTDTEEVKKPSKKK